MVVSKKFSALKSPQEAIVHHPIVICGLGSSVAHLLKPEHICLLFLIKKRDIKLDPRVSADWAFPLLCNTLTHRLPPPPTAFVSPSDQSSTPHSLSSVLLSLPTLTLLGLLPGLVFACLCSAGHDIIFRY